MKFDLMAHRLRVEKIKTIGDARWASRRRSRVPRTAMALLPLIPKAPHQFLPIAPSLVRFPSCAGAVQHQHPRASSSSPTRHAMPTLQPLGSQLPTMITPTRLRSSVCAGLCQRSVTIRTILQTYLPQPPADPSPHDWGGGSDGRVSTPSGGLQVRGCAGNPPPPPDQVGTGRSKREGTIFSP